MANESDSSPPQSKGRGRFEKGRNKLGSHGQSEDGCSTSSQGADEERSSHVRQQAPSVVWFGRRITHCYGIAMLMSAGLERGRQGQH